MIKLDIQKFAATYDPSSLTVILSKDEYFTSYVTVNFDSEDDTIINHYTTPIINPGYNLVNWNTEPDGSGHTYTWSSTPDDFYAQGDAEPNVTTTVFLFAQWQPNSYEITFDGNDATTQGTISTSITYGTNVLSPITNPQKSGCIFEGWYTQRSGGTLVINTSGVLQSNVPDITDSSGNWISPQDEVFYARWAIDFTAQTVLTDQDNFNDIADAIREQNGTQTTYKPEDMADAIRNISSDIDIVNATLDEYKTASGEIDAYSFVNFMNSHKMKTKFVEDDLFEENIVKAAATRINDNKVVLMYLTPNSNNDRYTLKGVVMTFPNDKYGDITFGNSTIIDENALNYYICTINLTSTFGIVGYVDYGARYNYEHVCCSSYGIDIVNNTITKKSKITHFYWRPGQVVLPENFCIGLTKTRDNAFAIFYPYYDNPKVVLLMDRVYCGSESTGIMSRYDYTFSSIDGSGYRSSACAINNSQTISSSYGVGSAVIYGNPGQNKIQLTFILSDTRGSSYKGGGGGGIDIYQNATTNPANSRPAICAVADNKVLVTYPGDNNNCLYGVLVTLSSSGSSGSCSLGTPFLIDAEPNSGWCSRAEVLDGNRVIVTYGGREDTLSPIQTKAIVLAYDSSNNSFSNHSTYYLSNYNYYEDATYSISGKLAAGLNCFATFLKSDTSSTVTKNNLAIFHIESNRLLIDTLVNNNLINTSNAYSLNLQSFADDYINKYDYQDFEYNPLLLGLPYYSSNWVASLIKNSSSHTFGVICSKIQNDSITATYVDNQLGYGEWADMAYDKKHASINNREFYVAHFDSASNIGKVCLTRYTINNSTGAITEQETAYITDSELGALDYYHILDIKVNALSFPGDDSASYKNDTFFLVTYCYRNSSDKVVMKGWLARKPMYGSTTLVKYSDPQIFINASRNYGGISDIHIVNTNAQSGCLILFYDSETTNGRCYKAFAVYLELNDSLTQIPTSSPFNVGNIETLTNTEKGSYSRAGVAECEGQFFVTYLRKVSWNRQQLYGFLISISDGYDVQFYNHIPLSKQSPNIDGAQEAYLFNLYLRDGRVLALYPTTISSGEYGEDNKEQKKNILKGTVYNIEKGFIEKETDKILSKDNLSGHCPSCILYSTGALTQDWNKSYEEKKYMLFHGQSSYVFPDDPGMLFSEQLVVNNIKDDEKEILEPIFSGTQKESLTYSYGEPCFYASDGLTKENVSSENGGDVYLYNYKNNGYYIDLNYKIYDKTDTIELYDYNLDITLPTDYELYLYKPTENTLLGYDAYPQVPADSSSPVPVSNMLTGMYLGLCDFSSSLGVFYMGLSGYSGGIYDPSNSYYNIYIEDSQEADGISLIDPEEFDLGNLRMLTYPCGLCSSLDGSLDAAKCSWEASAYQAGTPVGEVTLTIDFIKGLTNQELIAQNYYICHFNVQQSLDNKFILVPLSKYINSFDSTNGRITMDIPYLGFFMILKKYEEAE